MEPEVDTNGTFTSETVTEAEVPQPAHYYGDHVRAFLIAGAVIMLLTLPIFRDRISMPLPFSLISILIIGIAAGFTDPRYTWIAWVNMIITGLGLLIFEYYAVTAYGMYGIGSFLFLVDQLLALNFLVAVYYSVKTVRGLLLT